MATADAHRHGATYWLRILGTCIAAALVVTVIYSGVSWRTPPRLMIEAVAVSMLFSVIIGPLLALLMPRVGHAVSCRVSFPFNWIVLIATMIAIAVAGSFTAIALLAAVGYLHGAGIVATWLAGSLKASVVITLIFGIFVTAYETMRRRLDETTVALRTKERDEAEARRLAAEAQLASIESRVQPHFLFNTLNSIASLVHDDPAGAERMTGQLAALLRSSLDAGGSPLVSVEDELRVVRAYLDIERVRFGERLRYEIAIDEGARPAQVPRLAVQTLVENSVKYAVSPRREGGRIAVRAAAANGRLTVRVDDDGPGFDAAARPAGHGLALIEGRLRMLYGDGASLTISSTPGATSVSVTVPLAAEQSSVSIPSVPSVPSSPQSPIPNPRLPVRP